MRLRVESSYRKSTTQSLVLCTITDAFSSPLTNTFLPLGASRHALQLHSVHFVQLYHGEGGLWGPAEHSNLVYCPQSHISPPST